MTKTMHAPLYKPIKGEFLVPSYYDDFYCKGSDCRNTCCSGWSVKISMKEYFFLHGLSCKKELRIKLDSALRLLEKPSQDRYAEIAFDHNRRCRLLSSEGWCLLHKTYGENVLSSVCRYFPRGSRINYRWESSMSNGCEKTLELLFKSNEPITYHKKTLTFYLPLSTKRNENDIEQYGPVRDECIAMMQDRSQPLPKRILNIGKLLEALDQKEDWLKIEDLPLNNPLNVQEILSTAQTIGRWFIDHTGTFADDFMKIEAMYHQQDLVNLFLEKRRIFEETFLNHEIYFEKVLNNNIYFKQFPFQDYTDNFTDEFIALFGKYFIMRYLCLHLLDANSTLTDLIDLLTRMFRVIAHTGFEKNIMLLIKRLQLNETELISRLMLI